jgi:hypothetical protein
MTIDERLEKLAERHEALAQSVELWIAENRERDRKWEERQAKWEERQVKSEERHEALAQSVELLVAENRERDRKWEDRQGKLETYMARLMQSTLRLNNVTAVHDIELSDHAARIRDLESGNAA